MGIYIYRGSGPAWLEFLNFAKTKEELIKSLMKEDGKDYWKSNYHRKEDYIHDLNYNTFRISKKELYEKILKSTGDKNYAKNKTAKIWKRHQTFMHSKIKSMCIGEWTY